MRRTACVCLCLSALGASPAFAAGYGLKEHSADAMAAAYAGAAATDSDASYLAYNPAALAGVGETDFAGSLVGIVPGTKANYLSATTSAGNPTGGAAAPRNFISDALVPSFGIRHRMSERWAVGLDISAPWGLRTDYPASWAGRYYAMKTELLTINASPSVSYQISPGLALGAGAQIEFAQGALTSTIDTGTLGAANGIPGSIPGAQDSFARVSGKSWTFGYTAGLIAKPYDGLQIGISYRSSLQHDLKGPLTFTLDSAGIGATIRALTGVFTNTRATTPLTMPDEIEMGARQRLSDDWTVMAELDWTDWSRVHALRVEAANPLQPDDVTTTRWHNTLFGSLGAEYRASPDFTFRAGAAYDESPTPDATREPRIPDADRIWLSAGVRYRVTDALDANLTLSRLFFLKSTLALDPTIPGAALRGTLDGTTQAYVNVVGLQMSYRP
ncbi:MAG TPA: outer membrane protein transport protein [Rhizomicrobium sp.]|nr:outer membrane protein transport protein [Rhizomicrobium sp.]